jgi:starch-binding outer membrane protein, SusD/RagB family
MMITMKNTLIAILLLFTLSNCNDYLDEENKSEALANEYYTTARGYENLVNAAYASLRDVYKAPWVFEAGTDMFVEGRTAQPVGISEYMELASDDAVVEAFYQRCYAAIQRCNTAVYYNDKTEAASTLSTRLGEAKFLRAYYYFLLVQTFGGVPLVDQAILDAPQLEFERNSAEEVYAFIIQDLNEALNLVPETTAQFGRVTKRAVLHYLAKVHLTRSYEDFAAGDDATKAAQYADAAIAGQALSISFKDLFWPGKEKNDEVLFSIQFDKTSIKDPLVDGNNQSVWFGPYMGGEGNKFGYPRRSYTLCPTMYLFDLFTEDDARFEGTFMLTRYDRYYDFYDKNSTLSTLNINRFFAPKWITDIAAWRAEDPAHRTNTIVVPYPQPEDADPTSWEGKPGGADNATPPIRKFDDPSSPFAGAGANDGSSSRDLYLARLGETYLIAAEAYLKLNQTATAAVRINEVRRRADKSGENALQITDAEVNIDFILDERARELAGEYHRWFDLRRTGKLMERTELYNRDIKTKYFDNGINPFQGTDGQLKLYRPIPQKALDLNQNKDFPQNPGY